MTTPTPEMKPEFVSIPVYDGARSLLHPAPDWIIGAMIRAFDEVRYKHGSIETMMAVYNAITNAVLTNTRATPKPVDDAEVGKAAGRMVSAIHNHLSDLKLGSPGKSWYDQSGPKAAQDGYEYAEVPAWKLRQWCETIDDLVNRIAKLSAVTTERDDFKADYFRRHKEATDNYERAVAAETALSESEALAKPKVTREELIAVLTGTAIIDVRDGEEMHRRPLWRVEAHVLADAIMKLIEGEK